MGTLTSVTKWAFYTALVLVLLGVGAVLFVPNFDGSREGCYWTSALISYVNCDGFWGGGIIAAILNAPLIIFLWGPGFALYELRNLDSSGYGIMLPLGLASALFDALAASYALRWLLLKLHSLLLYLRS